MNPTLNEKVFRVSREDYYETQSMTVKGTALKTLLLLGFIVFAATTTWRMYYQATNPNSYTIWTWGGAIVAFILALLISFKPKRARILSPIYAVAEGLFLGGVSAMYNNIFANPQTGENAFPNLISSAVIITILCAIVMAIIYSQRIIKVNGKFTKILSVALISILAFYLIGFILSLFKVDLSLIYGNSLLSIAINIVIVLVAAFSLLTDYHFIEEASLQGAPKYMEWYGAFGLIVTLVWLYLEILKLLSKINSRN